MHAPRAVSGQRANDVDVGDGLSNASDRWAEVAIGPHPRTRGRERVAAGKVGYYADDHRARAVVYFAEPIHSGYLLIKRDHLANVTSLAHERGERARAEFCRKMGIG